MSGHHKWPPTRKGGTAIISNEINSAIHVIRGHRVMLSPDLAKLYGVEVRALVQAVKRNLDRFPDDFMFQLNGDEWQILKSQIVISSWGGARRAAPYAFTEHGVAMLSAVLNSQRAVDVSIQIVRAFVQLRQMLAGDADLVRRLDDLEKKYDHQFAAVFNAIRALMADPTDKAKPRIGYETEKQLRNRAVDRRGATGNLSRARARK